MNMPLSWVKLQWRMVVIKCIMMSFELVFELKVNFCKSRFGMLGVERSEGVKFARVLNCNLLALPFTYLGIPIGANPRRVETWKSVIDKFRKKLAPWKYKTLSFVRRICLINLVLSSLPILFF